MFPINNLWFLWRHKFELYNLWPEIYFYKMSEIWYETGITRFTFILIVHKCIVEAANLHVYRRTQVEDSIRVFNLPVGVAYYSNILLMIEIKLHILSPEIDARWCWVSMWRKQSLVYHVLNFISTMCLQLKLVA